MNEKKIIYSSKWKSSPEIWAALIHFYRKLISLILTLSILLGMIVPVSAADTTANVDISLLDSSIGTYEGLLAYYTKIDGSLYSNMEITKK